jgi:probable addiction module antidote protein
MKHAAHKSKAEMPLAARDNNIEKFDMDAINALPVFDVAEHLDSEEVIAAYLNEFLQDGTPAEIADALGTVARARGMTEVARESGMARESLYKALRPESSPRLETVMKVMKAFGVRLVVQPIHPAESSPT